MASKLYVRQIIFGQIDAKTSLAKSSANYQDFAEPQLLHERLFLYALKIAIYESVHTKRAVSFCFHQTLQKTGKFSWQGIESDDSILYFTN